MRGITIILTRDDVISLRAALSIASATTALQASARVYAHENAVRMLRHFSDSSDPDYTRTGLPVLSELIETAFDLGVEIIACQSGLALAKMNASDLDPRITIGGLISIMTICQDDRLITL